MSLSRETACPRNVASRLPCQSLSLAPRRFRARPARSGARERRAAREGGGGGGVVVVRGGVRSRGRSGEEAVAGAARHAAPAATCHPVAFTILQRGPPVVAPSLPRRRRGVVVLARDMRQRPACRRAFFMLPAA